MRAYPTGEALGDTGYVFQGEYRYIVPGFKICDGDVTLSTASTTRAGSRSSKDFIPPASAANPVAPMRTTKPERLTAVGGSVGRDADFVLRAQRRLAQSRTRRRSRIPPAHSARLGAGNQSGSDRTRETSGLQTFRQSLVLLEI